MATPQKQELTKKSSMTLTTPTWQKTLDLAKAIISKTQSVARLEMGLSIQGTLSKPTMRSVFKGETAQAGYSVVLVLVTRFIHSFGFSNKLDSSQLEMLTVDTLENFAYESLEDIILFFKMARSGKFGSTNRGVDSNLIFGDWYPKYLEQKAIMREQNYTSEKNEMSSVKVTDKDVEITYKKIREANKARRVQLHIDHVTKYFDRQMLEDLITDWSTDEVRKPFLHLLKQKRKTIK